MIPERDYTSKYALQLSQFTVLRAFSGLGAERRNLGKLRVEETELTVQWDQEVLEKRTLQRELWRSAKGSLQVVSIAMTGMCVRLPLKRMKGKRTLYSYRTGSCIFPKSQSEKSWLSSGKNQI